MRKGKFIKTFSKGKFWPLDPKAEEVKTIDIAHALSMLCRANGHYSHFYSVAQHSINCSHEAKERGLSEKLQLACLIHDASEAYISDITRPVKYLLDEYLEIEEALQNLIYKAYGLGDLSEEDIKIVAEIDDAMLNYEMKELLDYEGINNYTLLKEYDLSFKNMEEVKKEFVDGVEKLIQVL